MLCAIDVFLVHTQSRGAKLGGVRTRSDRCIGRARGSRARPAWPHTGALALPLHTASEKHPAQEFVNGTEDTQTMLAAICAQVNTRLSAEECMDCMRGVATGTQEIYERGMQFLQALRRSRNPVQSTAQVVVAGGGPAGLLAAVVASLSGMRVTVIEKRETRSRNTWFDVVTAEEGSPTREVLESLGMRTQNFNIQTHESTNVISLRCQVCCCLH
jgi:hypothetical protein